MASSLLTDSSFRRHVENANFHQRTRNIFSKVARPKTLKEEIQTFYARQKEGMPNPPAYLQNTVYAQLLKRQQDLLNKIPQVKLDPSIFDLDDSSTQGPWTPERRLTYRPNAVILDAIAPSPREMAALEILLQNSLHHALATHDLRLPTMWSTTSKGDNIDLDSESLQLIYQGPQKEETEASSIKANYCMKKQCGIYYFEIKVISKGMDGHIGIGFCMLMNSLDRLPGWEENSWGYHGNSGKISSGPGTEKEYGPHFSTGDVIGCGIDFRDMTAFYTKNGTYLGTAFRDIRDTEIYPFVGFKTRGEKIRTNFGATPFKFDIQQHILDEKRALISHIASHPLPIDKAATKNVVDRLVLNYLRHHGYSQSANSLEQSMRLLNKEDVLIEEDHVADSYYVRRQELHQWIMQGDIDSVIRLCDQHYPNVLKENINILFSLKCRKFLNMIQSAAKRKAATDTEEEYEADTLIISQHEPTTPKRNCVTAEIEIPKIKNKKPKTDNELEYFHQVLVYGNRLKEEYEQKAKEDSNIHDELSVRKQRFLE
ncbi:concanavalin A-like lectin/glucanase domain-containing protein [Sporodiniella umbellata]|nr:concanavalin A-like lectin/glucanase domain-containing protein [Sporodiniella umbellata]